MKTKTTPGFVSAHGTEFTSNVILEWPQQAGLTWHFIAPDKPMQNGICEAFNGRIRDKFLHKPLFVSRDLAREAAARRMADV